MTMGRWAGSRNQAADDRRTWARRPLCGSKINEIMTGLKNGRNGWLHMIRPGASAASFGGTLLPRRGRTNLGLLFAHCPQEIDVGRNRNTGNWEGGCGQGS